MKFCINMVCLRDEGTEQCQELMVLSREALVMETMGMTLAESKSLLRALQRCVIEQQATSYLELHRHIWNCIDIVHTADVVLTVKASAVERSIPFSARPPYRIRAGIAVLAHAQMDTAHSGRLGSG
jgi:hypothetical protein